MARQNVLLVGAAGHTEKSILDGLLEYGKYEVEPLIRPSSAQKPEVKKMAERGVIDVCISSLAKKAEVQRFVPCLWATVAPPRGVMMLRNLKELVSNHIRNLYFPYTVIEIGLWHQVYFPRVSSGRFDYAPIFPNVDIHGDGNMPNVIDDLRDIGNWTAHFIEDERMLNKFVFVCSDLITENKLWLLWRSSQGKKSQFEEVESRLEEARKNVEKDPQNFYMGYLDARELYLDFKPISFRDFLKDLDDGKTERPRYNFGAAVNMKGWRFFV
ncbi:isoflavone reductase family protein [Macrophomina phaseolina]|uniref:Isoflavone reductase family protein n=1 Tax=Macrophomina phaseolina TaxID=35725 RepID=A0ABQ8G2V7_9PEZI|nr:isoflavone reductase family protein [Macrophomina phaseolina]